MRPVLAVVAALALSTAAHAAEVDAKVTKIDPDKQTVTLDDGQTYKIPGEFDISTLQKGMEIVIAYDKVDGQNLITDMQLPDEQ